jgi:cysteinyl-tRNA synthetase
MDFLDASADPEVARLMKDREAARAQKNWALADKIREQLRDRGVRVQDGKIN